MKLLAWPVTTKLFRPIHRTGPSLALERHHNKVNELNLNLGPQITHFSRDIWNSRFIQFVFIILYHLEFGHWPTQRNLERTTHWTVVFFRINIICLLHHPTLSQSKFWCKYTKLLNYALSEELKKLSVFQVKGIVNYFPEIFKLVFSLSFYLCIFFK